MFNRRGLLLITISLALALGAAWVARSWLQARLSAAAAPTNDSVPVIIAAMEIPFGTKVEARHVRVITLPRSAPLGAHYEKTEDVVGLVATQKVVGGEILLKERFADRVSGSTLAAIVKPEMRAVTVRVDDVVGVGGFLLPGNHVDVVASRMNPRDQRAEAKTVLRDLNVLAVDQTASKDKDEPVVVRAVTLEVTPQQAEVLVKSREEGKIQLTLRNPLDAASNEETSVAIDESSKRSHNKARAEVVSTPGSGITIIRGTNVHNSEATM